MNKPSGSLRLPWAALVMVVACAGAALWLLASLMPWERFYAEAYQHSEHRASTRWPPRVVRAEFIADRLWIRTHDYQLWTVDEATGETRRLPVPSPALDICRASGRPVIVTQGADHWSLLEYTDSRWSPIGQVRKSGEPLVGLACDDDGVNLLTTRRLVQFSNGTSITVRLSPIRVPSMQRRTVGSTPRAIFVGFALGEWGGGLMRIDRATGQVTDLRSNVSGERCGGPLNPECDPVTGVVQRPGAHDCAIAAAGLMYGFFRGRLIEVCGASIRTFYLGPCPEPQHFDGSTAPDGEPYCTEVWGGVVRAGNHLVAVGNNGLSRIDAEGRLQSREPLPPFKSYGPFLLAFIPDAVIVGDPTFRPPHPYFDGSAVNIVGR